LGKIKIDFSDFLGSAVLAGSVTLFFFVQLYLFFLFLKIFFRGYNSELLDDFSESTLLAGGKSKKKKEKKDGNLGDTAPGQADLGSAFV
jgi:hypothetical protein